VRENNPEIAYRVGRGTGGSRCCKEVEKRNIRHRTTLEARSVAGGRSSKTRNTKGGRRSGQKNILADTVGKQSNWNGGSTRTLRKGPHAVL